MGRPADIVGNSLGLSGMQESFRCAVRSLLHAACGAGFLKALDLASRVARSLHATMWLQGVHAVSMAPFLHADPHAMHQSCQPRWACIFHANTQGTRHLRYR